MPKNYYKRGTLYYGRKVIKGEEFTHPLETASANIARKRAKKWVEELVAEQRGETPKAAVSFDDAVRHYTETHFPRIKKNTRKRYLHSLMLLTEHFAGMDLTKIGSADLVAFETWRRQPRHDRAKGGRGRDGADDATIRRDLTTLSGVFEIAMESDLVDVNPVPSFLKKAKRRGMTENPPRNRYLSHVEEHDLILASKMAPGIRPHTAIMLAVFIVLSIDLGLREDELLTLSWERVDLDRNEVYIPKDLAKRDSSERRVPILPRSQRLLKKLPRHKHSNYVLHRENGSRYFKFWHQVQKAVAFAGFSEHSTVHDLRRTCGVRLLRDHKMTMAAVSRWLGHSSIKVTERVYAFLEIDDLHAAVGTARESLRPPEIEPHVLVTKSVPTQRLIGYNIERTEEH